METAAQWWLSSSTTDHRSRSEEQINSFSDPHIPPWIQRVRSGGPLIGQGPVWRTSDWPGSGLEDTLGFKGAGGRALPRPWPLCSTSPRSSSSHLKRTQRDGIPDITAGKTSLRRHVLSPHVHFLVHQPLWKEETEGRRLPPDGDRC
ncbi:unnamed protein product [Arctogadus glacialis]